MYPNLRGEMAKRNITVADLAKALGKTSGTVSQKLSGKYAFSLDEAIAIRTAVGTKMPLDELFSKEVI